MTRKHKKNIKHHSRRVLYVAATFTFLLIIVNFVHHGFNIDTFLELQGHLFAGICEALGIKMLGAE